MLSVRFRGGGLQASSSEIRRLYHTMLPVGVLEASRFSEFIVRVALLVDPAHYEAIVPQAVNTEPVRAKPTAVTSFSQLSGLARVIAEREAPPAPVFTPLDSASPARRLQLFVECLGLHNPHEIKCVSDVIHESACCDAGSRLQRDHESCG